MTEFRDLAQRTLDASYRRLGGAAEYYPSIGGVQQAPVSVRVMPFTRDVIDQTFDQARVKSDISFRVRVSEIAEPTQNGVIRHNGIDWRITAKPVRHGERGLEWELGCGRKANP